LVFDFAFQRNSKEGVDNKFLELISRKRGESLELLKYQGIGSPPKRVYTKDIHQNQKEAKESKARKCLK